MVKRIAKCSVLALGLLFIYTPILLLVVFSFTPATTLGVWEGFSFDLYIQLFNNAKIMNIVTEIFTKKMDLLRVTEQVKTFGGK